MWGHCIQSILQSIRESLAFAGIRKKSPPRKLFRLLQEYWAKRSVYRWGRFTGMGTKQRAAAGAAAGCVVVVTVAAVMVGAHADVVGMDGSPC